jgi:sugar phosphate isomerase/epimerase
MSTEETPGVLDARQRELAVLLAQAGIDPGTATFGDVADALAEPRNRARLAEALRDAERRVALAPELVAALAPHLRADAEPKSPARPSVPTYEEFLEKWVRVAADQSRPAQQHVHRHGGLADDDPVAEQP